MEERRKYDYAEEGLRLAGEDLKTGYFARECQTQPVGFAIMLPEGPTFVGCGVTKLEAKTNAFEAFIKFRNGNSV